MLEQSRFDAHFSRLLNSNLRPAGIPITRRFACKGVEATVMGKFLPTVRVRQTWEEDLEKTPKEGQQPCCAWGLEDQPCATRGNN
jgi:hypothetical protein